MWECVQERWGAGGQNWKPELERLVCPLLPAVAGLFFCPFFCPRAHLRPLSAALWLGSACLGSLGTVKLRLAWADRGFVAEPHRLGRSSPRQQDDPGHWSVLSWSAQTLVQSRYVLAVLASAAAWLVGADPTAPSNKRPRFVWCNPSPSSTRLDLTRPTGHSQENHLRPVQHSSPNIKNISCTPRKTPCVIVLL